MRIALADQFRKHVARRGPDECWPWTGTVAADGRGYLRDRGTGLLATRLAVALDAGVRIRAIPSEDFVCHTCDHPSSRQGQDEARPRDAASLRREGARGDAPRCP